MKYINVKKRVLNLENIVKTELYWYAKEKNYNRRMSIKGYLSNQWIDVYSEICGYRNSFELKDNDPLWAKMRIMQKQIGMLR